jgi:hypothetical protein
MYPSNALKSEWDILSVILDYIPLLPVPLSVQHVKGHQDKEAPVSIRSLSAQLNCEADALATEALLAIAAPIPMSLVFPSAVCQLDVDDATVTRKIQASLRFSAMAPAMSQYLRDRNDWDEAAYASVSWPAFGSARFPPPIPSLFQNIVIDTFRSGKKPIVTTRNTRHVARRVMLPSKPMNIFCCALPRLVSDGGSNFLRRLSGNEPACSLLKP